MVPATSRTIDVPFDNWFSQHIDSEVPDFEHPSRWLASSNGYDIHRPTSLPLPLFSFVSGQARPMTRAQRIRNCNHVFLIRNPRSFSGWQGRQQNDSFATFFFYEAEKLCGGFGTYLLLFPKVPLSCFFSCFLHVWGHEVEKSNLVAYTHFLGQGGLLRFSFASFPQYYTCPCILLLPQACLWSILDSIASDFESLRSFPEGS